MNPLEPPELLESLEPMEILVQELQQRLEPLELLKPLGKERKR